MSIDTFSFYSSSSYTCLAYSKTKLTVLFLYLFISHASEELEGIYIAWLDSILSLFLWVDI